MLKEARTAVACVVSLVLACMAGGCAVFQRGPSDEELLKDLLCTFETGINERDAEKLVGLYSKDYIGSEGEDYGQEVAELRQIVPQLDSYGVEVSTAETEIEIEGKKARISPIVLKTDWDDMVLTFTAAKEDDGCWRITGSEMQE